MTNPETWIVYKAQTMSAPGWEDRMLLPGESLTDILWENWSSSGREPSIGDRIREYTNLEDPGNGITHGRDGDWVVERICHFTSTDIDQKIIVCYCSYQPVEVNWEKLHRACRIYRKRRGQKKSGYR
ncbi:MAG TPA: hypothetical protein DCE56_29510 [Cyanobacteria bacterium UBA8553]|nr:hypothetical protein [Cyanobacteria bacterium UBA8553]